MATEPNAKPTNIPTATPRSGRGDAIAPLKGVDEGDDGS
jgi:hypothetical protein